MTVMDPGDDHPTLDTSLAVPAALPPAPALINTQVEAFSAFYRAQITRLVAFLRWQGADWADAADAAQDAMAKAYQRWDSLRNPAAWVRTVATREYLRRRYSGEDVVAEVPESANVLLRDDVPADAEDQEQERRVQVLLSILPPRQRQVMAWTYDGYTPSEIADQLSTPDHPLTPAAARASLKLARRTLAQHLSPVKDQP